MQNQSMFLCLTLGSISYVCSQDTLPGPTCVDLTVCLFVVRPFVCLPTSLFEPEDSLRNNSHSSSFFCVGCESSQKKEYQVAI